MVRRYFRSYFLITLISTVSLVLSVLAFKPTAETVFLAAGIAALITVARSSPAPTRSFLKRLLARTDEPVPSTI